ncbi:MAG TPA: exodeoxyribonuclease VII small subunit [Polyangiaceae bacterium]|nr:exodeoxyribonuclease VII small subunit [Polyangiaceae bacterium]
MATKRLSTPDLGKPDDAPNPEGPSFEESIRRLNEIVETLESGELPLEQSVTLFEEGIKLSRASQAKLDRAEKRVEELLSIDDSGNPVVRDLDVE